MTGPTSAAPPARRTFFWALALGLVPVVSLPLVLYLAWREIRRARAASGPAPAYLGALKALALLDVVVAACWALELLAPALPPAATPRLGVELAEGGAPAAPQGAPGKGIPQRGAAIERVQPGSPAERGGLRAGDQLLRIDGVPVPDAAAVARELAREPPGTSRVIEYRRQGRYGGTVVTPDEGRPRAPAAPPDARGDLFQRSGPAGSVWPGTRAALVALAEVVLCLLLWLWARQRGVAAGPALLGVGAALVGGLLAHTLALVVSARLVGGASNGGALLALLAQVLVTLGVAALARTLQARRVPGSLAPRPPGAGNPLPPLRAVGLGLLLLLGGAIRLGLLTVTVERLTGLRLNDVQVTEAFGHLALGHAGGLVLLGVTVALLGPVGEELIYRGLLLPTGLRLFGPGRAVLVSAAVFALAHGGTYGLGLIQVIWAGVALGWTTVASGRLWPAVVIHAAYNGALVLIWLWSGR